MIQKFSFKGEPYIAFGKPTEVPDEVLEHRLQCLFFDSFNHVEDNHSFSYLAENFDNTDDDVDSNYSFESRDAYYRFCAIKQKVYNEMNEKVDFSSNKNNKKENITMANIGMDFGKALRTKMILSAIDKMNGDIDVGTLIKLQCTLSMFGCDGCAIDDSMKQIIAAKFMINFDEKNDDLPIDKLAVLDMLNNGQLDISRLLSIKMMSKLFDETKKE